MKANTAANPIITSRAIAAGRDWSMAEVVCRAGPRDAPYEELHSHVSIAAVVSGTFSYRCDAGRALMYPGALMLGNAGACFECGHEHGAGDRCIAFHMSRPLFEEVAASAAGTGRFCFAAATLPAMPALMPALVEIEALANGTKRLGAEQLTLRLAEQVAETFAGQRAQAPAPARGDERRISTALRHIEDNADRTIDLDELAALAHMSKYHFLRVFRRVTGATPYKYLIDVRMRRAAVKLATTREAVAAIAFDAGFGDLSTFNNRFRAVFGQTPTQFRAGY